MIVLIVAVTTISCKKSSTDPSSPPVADKYSVTYKLDMTGDYTDFKLVYYETGSVTKEVTSVTFPWEKSFDNFVLGDSVVMNFSFMTVLEKPTTFIYSTEVFLDGISIDGVGPDTTTGFNPPTVEKKYVPVYSYKIAN